MKACARTRELLALRIDAALPAEDEDYLSEHLETCDDCVAVAGWLGEVDALAAAIDDREPSEAHLSSIADATMAALHTEPSAAASRSWWSRSWLPRITPLAAIVAVLAVFTLRQDQESPVVVPAATPRLAIEPAERADDGDVTSDARPSGEILQEESFAKEAVVDRAELDQVEAAAPAPELGRSQAPASTLVADAVAPAPTLRSLWNRAKADDAPEQLTRLLIALENSAQDEVLDEVDIASSESKSRDDAPLARRLQQQGQTPSTLVTLGREREQLSLMSPEDSLRAFLRLRAQMTTDSQLRTRLLRLVDSEATLWPNSDLETHRE